MSALQMAVDVLHAIGWSLVHFLWQAVLVGAVYAALRTILPRGNPRYVAAMLALVALALIPAWTAWHELRWLMQSPAVLQGMVVTGAAAAGPGVPVHAAPADWLAGLRAALPWLVLAWAAGVTFLVTRVVRQWRGLREIVRAAELLPAWQERARELGRELGLRRAIRVLASVRIATPTLVGWVRPVVVVPLAMLARMPPEQVDLILAHELAHLRRLDHVANLFQVVVETLFFYHPVVHWISRDARHERELCCDALALRATGGRRRDFVAALAGLEEFRAVHAGLALAASGGVLAERAWFIAGALPARRHPRAGLTVALAALLGVALVSTLAWRQDVQRQRSAALMNMAEAAWRQFATVAVPSRVTPDWRVDAGARPVLAPVAPAQVEADVVDAKVFYTPSPTAMPRLAVSDVATSLPGIAAVVAADHVPATSAAPRVLRAVAPAYPSQAQLAGIQGQVEIQFSLTAAGEPRDLRVLHASTSGIFDAAALLALSRWRFAPPAVPGQRYRQIFTFRLDAAAGDDAASADACLARTGTHICRHVLDAEPVAGARPPQR